MEIQDLFDSPGMKQLIDENILWFMQGVKTKAEIREWITASYRNEMIRKNDVLPVILLEQLCIHTNQKKEAMKLYFDTAAETVAEMDADPVAAAAVYADQIREDGLENCEYFLMKYQLCRKKLGKKKNKAAKPAVKSVQEKMETAASEAPVTGTEPAGTEPENTVDNVEPEAVEPERTDEAETAEAVEPERADETKVAEAVEQERTDETEVAEAVEPEPADEAEVIEAVEPECADEAEVTEAVEPEREGKAEELKTESPADDNEPVPEPGKKHPVGKYILAIAGLAVILIAILLIAKAVIGNSGKSPMTENIEAQTVESTQTETTEAETETTEAPVQPVTAEIYCSSGTVKVRTGPGTSYETVALVNGLGKFTVTCGETVKDESGSDLEWTEISIDEYIDAGNAGFVIIDKGLAEKGGTYYIASQYLKTAEQ